MNLLKLFFDDFREELLEKILKNNDFIKSSSQIFRIIVSNPIEVNDPDEMVNNINNIKGEKN
jgi:hypothetical protein